MAFDDVNGPGVLVYKCRRCGELIKPTHAPHALEAMFHAMHATGHAIDNRGWRPAMLAPHHCADDQCGVADLIGAERDR